MSRRVPAVLFLLAFCLAALVTPGMTFAATGPLKADRSVTVSAPSVVRVAVGVPCRAGIVTVSRAGSRAARGRVRQGRARVRVALPGPGRHRLAIKATGLKRCAAGAGARLRARIKVQAGAPNVPASAATPASARPAGAPSSAAVTPPTSSSPPAPRADGSDEALAAPAPLPTPPATSVPAPSPSPTPGDGPEDVPLGAAVTVNNFNAAYQQTFLDNFDSLTPENELKMEVVRPAEGTWDFGPGDRLVAFARDNGKLVRGHTLLWDQQIPSWVRGKNWTREQWRAFLRDYIHTVVGRYRGRIDAWDVVNEPIDDWTSGLKNTFWLSKLGPDYIADGLRWAHEADPDVKLFINDYSVEKPGRKSNALLALAQSLRAQGVPLDGIGFQAHVQSTWYPSESELRGNLERFTALGLRVEITEADVRTDDMGSGASQSARNAKQADIFGGMARACASVAACDRFTAWGIVDNRSWLGTAAQGLLFDAAGTAKPAYAATRDALQPR